MSRLFVSLMILGGACLTAGGPNHAQAPARPPVSSLRHAQIDPLQAQLNALQVRRGAQNDGVIRPGLPHKKFGPGDKLPLSRMVYGVRMARGQTWGTDRKGHPLIALSPRAVLVRPAPSRSAAPCLL